MFFPGFGNTYSLHGDIGFSRCLMWQFFYAEDQFDVIPFFYLYFEIHLVVLWDDVLNIAAHDLHIYRS